MNALLELAERCNTQAGLLRGHIASFAPGILRFTKSQRARELAGYSVSAAADILDECAAALRARASIPTTPPETRS